MSPAEVTVRGRTLIAILVYGGGNFVIDCLESASLLARASEVDVVVFDDHSPDASWSDDIRARCERLGIGYYRSPRNIGIPRNMNLALLSGAERGYDYVVIANSDVIFPQNLVAALAGAASCDPTIASVTAWSNHVSSFSLENFNAPETVGRQEALDRVSNLLGGHFGARVVEVPVGVGFCMLIPVTMISQVGLFDPIFGRGYCEEVDWCLRAERFGFRNMLAPSTFTFHIGNATSKAFGVLEHWESSDPANEAIIDLRYPRYRQRLAEYDEQPVLRSLRTEAEAVLMLHAAREHGYLIEVTDLGREFDYGPQVRVVVGSHSRVREVRLLQGGFASVMDVDGSDLVAALTARIGAPPAEVIVRDRGPAVEVIAGRARALGIPVTDNYCYPQDVVPRPAVV